MITVENKQMRDIPTLIVEKEELKGQALPTMIYFHGFTSAKEHNLPLAYLLAEEGYRVLLPDSLHHGEREQGISEKDRQLAFWDVVFANVAEFSELHEALLEADLLLDERIAVSGTSMGGITTAACLAKYPSIKSAAILMGSPQLTLLAEELIKIVNQEQEIVDKQTEEQLLSGLDPLDLSLHPERLNNRPLMFWHGEKDKTIPFEQAFSFYENVKTTYQIAENIQFIREANSDHKVSRYAIINTVNWFKKHL